MATVRFADDFAVDLLRIAEHLAAHEIADIGARLDSIVDALQVLTRHPLLGRKAGHGLRELVIGRGSRGYIALYRYDELDDEVVVAALRAQKEAGFPAR